MHRRPVLPVAALVLLALTGCAGKATPNTAAPAAADAASNVVTGRISLAGGAYLGSTPCRATDGYEDIAEGAEVDVLDNAGKVLAIGSLNAGSEDVTTYTCDFDFTVNDVPTGGKIYGVKIGNQARGVVHFNEDQLFSGEAALTLG